MIDERAPGFYWVRQDGEEWTVARWNGRHWRAFGVSFPAQDSFWDEIIPTRIPEPGQSVHVEGCIFEPVGPPVIVAGQSLNSTPNDMDSNG